MHNKLRILLTLALFAVAVSSMAFRPTASYADGNIHVVVVCSTTDPSLSDKVDSWKKLLLETLTEDNPGCSFTSKEAMSPAAKSGLGSDGVTIYPVLEGEKATPQNIMETCLEVSHNAGPDDAIVFFIACHGNTQKGTDQVKRHYFAPIATSSDAINIQKNRIQRETILKSLTHEIVNDELREKNHRLIMLISDSCATTSSDLVIEHNDNTSGVANGNAHFQSRWVEPKEFLKAKDKSYFRKCLETAPHGTVININSCNDSQEATYVKSDIPAFNGSIFINAFRRFATNGFYLDDEVDAEGFYKLLSIELARQRMEFINASGKQCDQLLTQYDGNVALEPKDPKDYGLVSQDDFKKYYEKRAKDMKDSGEFEIERTGGFNLNPPGIATNSNPEPSDPFSTGNATPNNGTGHEF